MRTLLWVGVLSLVGVSTAYSNPSNVSSLFSETVDMEFSVVSAVSSSLGIVGVAIPVLLLCALLGIVAGAINVVFSIFGGLNQEMEIDENDAVDSLIHRMREEKSSLRGFEIAKSLADKVGSESNDGGDFFGLRD
jgi:hypothetical protein